MKKILLGTTALFGAVLVSQAALADGPKVTVGGDSEFEGGLDSNNQSNDAQNRGFYTRNEISFKVDGKSDAGLGYGGEVWLQADTSGSENGQGVNATRTFVYLDGMWGRAELGSNYGADETLKVDASVIARATGGIAGDWQYFAGGNSKSSPFMSSPDLPINFGITAQDKTSCTQDGGLADDCTKNLNKATYYTPKWYGFQAGLSYDANDANRGQSINPVNSTAGLQLGGSGNGNAMFSDVSNIWQGGVNWTGSWDQVGIALAATGERGDAEVSGYNNLSAWQTGGKLSYMGFSVAGSYADWGDSLRQDAVGNQDAHNWTAGAAYEYGPYGVSLTYLNGTMGVENAADTKNAGSDKFTNYVLGADYKLAPGLTPYAEVSFYDENGLGTGASNDNSGHLFLLGTQLNF